MSFRTALLAVADKFRAVSGPALFDIRTNQLTIRKRVWSGSYIADGVATDTDLVLPAQYPIRHVTGADVASSGGHYTLTDLLVNHITPYNGVGVGYTPTQLVPDITDDRTQLIYVITGPDAGEYDLVEAKFSRPFSYQLILRRKASTP